MNGLHVMLFCLLVGIQAGAIVWAAWTADELRQKSAWKDTGEKSKCPITNPRRLENE